MKTESASDTDEKARYDPWTDKPKRPYRKGPRRTIFKKQLPETRAERKAGNLEGKHEVQNM